MVVLLVIDFRTVLLHSPKRADIFYFYPRGRKGIIESCILATQRRFGDQTHRLKVELQIAYEQWLESPENQYEVYLKQRNPKNDIEDALLVAELMQEEIFNMIDYHIGEQIYAINPRTFQWVNPCTLAFTIVL